LQDIFTFHCQFFNIWVLYCQFVFGRKISMIEFSKLLKVVKKFPKLFSNNCQICQPGKCPGKGANQPEKYPRLNVVVAQLATTFLRQARCRSENKKYA
jgi:hypothetical protein